MLKHIDHLYTMHDVDEPVAIRCPRCGREAAFEDAYSRTEGSAARAWAADPNVTGVWVHSTYIVIHHPEILSWDQISSSRTVGEMIGICRCGHCGYLARHTLDWPADAYYTASIRGRTLWAWTRAHVVALRRWIASERRDKRSLDDLPYGIARTIKRAPAWLLFARNRAEAVKKLDRLLADGPEPRAIPSRPLPSTAK